MHTYKKILFLLSLFFSLLFSEENSHSLLIEAENFYEKGGWVVDPQFVEEMGSPYLLAHGFGKPVEDARTDVELPLTGNYYIWVRTKNWMPGDWAPPGRFKLSVDGIEIETVLGTGMQEEWHWQYVGEIYVDHKNVSVSLKDLTGFEGRCDAIYFSTDQQAPPEDPDLLEQWRNQLNPKEVTTHTEYDFVIVGGGIAGCAAAIAAAQRGLQVALIQDRPVLGGNSSGEIRVHTLGIPWHGKKILSQINSGDWTKNGSSKAKEDDIRRYRNISRYKNIHLYLNRRAYKVKTQNNTITDVFARNTKTGDIECFQAPFYLDATGDGWIGYWAGAETMYGRESRYTYNEGNDEYGELWSPSEKDNRVMGASILWKAVETNQENSFPEVPWALDVAKDFSATKGSWKWEFTHNDLHQIYDAEYIRDHMFCAIYGAFYNAKQKEGNEKRALQWVSYLIGKRESRRIVGDYVYTFNDMRDAKRFSDAVVKGKRDVDVHYQQILEDPDKPDFLSQAMFYKVKPYYIPYRTLYSKDIDNLFIAGRCFSASHIGLCGPRVMNSTGQMGVATGYAAALCLKYDTTPRGIYENHVEELKSLIYRETVHDFNGDGISDIFWRGGKQNGLWLMRKDGSHKWVPQISKTEGFIVVGIGDFDGDGLADLFWRNAEKNGLWLMRKDGSHKWVPQVSKPVGFQVSGTGDFNGDGLADIFWRNKTQNGLWLMKRDGSHKWVPQPEKQEGFIVAGIGDFNGDAISDIFWRRGAENGLWLMREDGSHKWVPQVNKPEGFIVAGVGDFNGDGIADIFWRRGAENGLWLMREDGSHKWVPQVAKPEGFSVAEVGDFNGDGIADIFWRRGTENGLWLMRKDGSHKWVPQVSKEEKCKVTPENVTY